MAHLDVYTAGGEMYYHDSVSTQKENGHYVWINVADKELARSWERRSALPFLAPDAKGQELRATLVRYLASMGQRKDSIGMRSLTDADIHRIEQGVVSVDEGRRDPIRARIDEVLYEMDEYRTSADPNGHSVTMRYEFLRAGWAIAREHWLTGVGTGDTPRAFADHYARVNSPLRDRWRLRAHNEYLTLLISFGVFGLFICLLSWVWPAVRLGAFKQPLFVCWAIIFGVSCLSEDTIETQAGATFFALFYTLLVFASPVKVGAPTDQLRAADRSA